jgi:DNA repair protein RecN (Recombination protein N)
MMLAELHITNFAIIEDITLVLGPGLTVLTGETGAGKSILIEAIQLLLGAKASPDQVREGAAEAVVEGLFDLSDAPAQMDALLSRGLEVSGEVLLRRVLSRGGRSRTYINGQLSSIQMLAEIGRGWVNIYGQHEHQTLLQPERHLDLLDEYGGLMPLRGRWEDLWKRLERVKGEIHEAEARVREAAARRELWEFQRAEIRQAGLRPGEEEGLEQERKVLLNVERIRQGLGRAEEALYGAQGSVLERVQTVAREMRELAQIAPRLSPLLEAISHSSLTLEEAVHGIRQEMRQMQGDPGRLAEVEERLAEIHRLKRKYKGTVPEILSLLADIERQLSEAERGDEEVRALLRKKEETEEALLGIGVELSEARRTVGLLLSRGVERELRDLGMDQPVFEVKSLPLQEGVSLGAEGVKAGGRGMDQIEFLLSANVGEPPRPLARIASGGELSRIMLALKRVLADAERVPTLVLDEIDAGIGGAVAEALGEKLAHIAKRHQVLCITHLPQIACYATTHFKVSKELKGGRTIARVELLDEGGRLEEISRMLGGRVITDKTRAHARELLGRALG